MLQFGADDANKQLRKKREISDTSNVCQTDVKIESIEAAMRVKDKSWKTIVNNVKNYADQKLIIEECRFELLCLCA
jgi:hypothetical protein